MTGETRMGLTPLVKSIIEKFPYSVGACIARVPYSMRPGIGSIYRKRKAELVEVNEQSADATANFIFVRMKAIVTHAFQNIHFYRQYYQQYGFDPSQLASFKDLDKIPTITKKQLQDCPLGLRSFPQKGRYLVNTGGSSGSPLNFYVLPSAMGNEWAHMHHIWAKLGYGQHELKLSFGGRDVKNDPVYYDALRHSFAVNIYRPNHDIADALKKILRYRNIRYLHGYPSALYDFACYCESQEPELTAWLRTKLKGAFLGSEFPTQVYRNKIETVFNIPTLSFYGHTERAVLATERDEPFVYNPFQSYGFAEAVLDPERQTMKLMGTTYYNIASPLIRYDTGDEIEAVEKCGNILTSFRIAGGREGDYVTDVNGKKISLTGLVFGRHHQIFDRAKFIQVSQEEPGQMTFYVTPNGQRFVNKELADLFDLSGIDMVFDFIQLKDPILTPSGKIGLKVNAKHGAQEKFAD